MRREDLHGTWAMEREAQLSSTQRDELARQALAHGLESADSIRDRTIPLFDRTGKDYSAGCRFMGVPFLAEQTWISGAVHPWSEN
jgi:agmatinase